MGWSGQLTANSEVGSSVTYTPDNPESTPPATNWVNSATYAGNYSVSAFKAPRRGIYRFVLNGSGGVRIVKNNTSDSAPKNGSGTAGTGGKTTGYLLLEQDETVYVGAGGVCRAAFVSRRSGASLAAIPKDDVLFVAGAGASAGAYWDSKNRTGYNCRVYAGGNGGGTSGVAGTGESGFTAGKGGAQTAGGAAGTTSNSNSTNGSAGTYGVGGNGGSMGSPSNGKYKAYCGRGGDGFYGGGGGSGQANDGGVIATGGGGSGYVKVESFTVAETVYMSTTSQSGGSTQNNPGSVIVTFYALGELPIIFDGVRVTELIFNGTHVTSLIFNGVKLFMERLKKRKEKAHAKAEFFRKRAGDTADAWERHRRADQRICGVSCG